MNAPLPKLLSLLSPLCLLALAPGCEAESQTLDYDLLSEHVAIEAGLDDWQVCVADPQPEAESIPACESPSAGASVELSSPAGQEEVPAIIECSKNCCYFFDSFDYSGMTMCCNVPDGPPECKVIEY